MAILFSLLAWYMHPPASNGGQPKADRRLTIMNQKPVIGSAETTKLSPSREEGSPDSDADDNDARHISKRTKKTPKSQQANTIERLMNNVDKPMEIPTVAHKNLKRKGPKEFVMNVQGMEKSFGVPTLLQ